MNIELRDAQIDIKPSKEILKERGLAPHGAVQKVVDSEVLRLCAPYVPLQDATLIRSGIIHTKIGSGLVVYSTPYARRHYYRPARFNGAPKRGNYWFERMKKEGGKEKILRIAVSVSGAKK